MRVLLVYYSQFGNTRQVAETIAGILQAVGDVSLLELAGVSTTTLPEFDVVVMGAPTHKMNMPDEVRSWFAETSSTRKGKFQFAAFDTSYELSWWLRPFTGARRVARRLRRLGGIQIASPMTFHIEHDHEGPLMKGELERARQWAQQLVERLESG